MSSKLTDIRHALRDGVQPLLKKGEEVSVATGASEYAGNLDRLGFDVTVIVGKSSEETAERLDELLSGPVKEALEALSISPNLKKCSGYQHIAPEQLGATWTVEILD